MIEVHNEPGTLGLFIANVDFEQADCNDFKSSIVDISSSVRGQFMLSSIVGARWGRSQRCLPGWKRSGWA